MEKWNRDSEQLKSSRILQPLGPFKSSVSPASCCLWHRTTCWTKCAGFRTCDVTGLNQSSECVEKMDGGV